MLLRPYQERMVTRAVAALEAHGDTLAVAPTGAGKTLILSALAGRMGGRQCILQHRDELTIQNLKKYRMVNPKTRVGLFNADSKSWNGDATFAMVQTLSREKSLQTVPSLDLLIIDEAHHAVAQSYRKIVDAVRERNPACRIFGVTATPARSDGKGLRHIFSNCCDQISLHHLIQLGFLVRPRTFVCTLEGTDDKLASLRRTASGEFDMHEAEAVLDLKVHNAAVVREWKKLAGDRKTIVFASTVAHAGHVAEIFRAEGIVTEIVHGGTSAGERASILKRFDDGNVQVLINVAVLTEGYDSQPVSCVILLRPCSCKSTMLQMIGRGLRTVDPSRYPGITKTDCIIMDFGRSLVTHQDLESKVRMEDKQKLCPECEAEVPYGVTECPICGHEFKGPERGEAGGADESLGETVSNVVMSEVDILEASPFRWCDLFGSGRVMLASGFEAWSAVCSADGERWVSLGKLKGERELRRLLNGERTQALAAADDFLRMNESDDAAKKNRRWLNDAITTRQWELLQRLGYGQDMMLAFTKYSAACTLNFFWHRQAIEHEVLHG